MSEYDPTSDEIHDMPILETFAEYVLASQQADEDLKYIIENLDKPY